MEIKLIFYSLDDLETQVEFIKDDLVRGLSLKEIKDKYCKEKHNDINT